MRRNILLNPGLATTTDTVKRAQVVPDICPREKEFTDLMAGIRRDLLKVVHVEEDEFSAVLFCGSGTLCMDVCLNSLLDGNGRILILDNGAYSKRAAEICRYYHLPHYDVKLPDDIPVKPEQVERFLSQHSDVSVVYTTHQETGTGLLNPIRDIGKCVHSFDVKFVVDTTSTFAMIPIEMEAEYVDFCMASAQKGIMGMTGLSFVVGRTSMIRESKDFPTRSYYNNLYRQYEYIEKTGQMEFTPPVQTIYAARQALNEYFGEGEAAKWERHKRVYRALRDGLATLGFRSYLSEDKEAQLVTTALYPDDRNWDFDRVHDYCYERGYTIYPGKVGGIGMFRLCALGAIDVPDIDAFFAAFREALTQYEISVPVYYHL